MSDLVSALYVEAERLNRIAGQLDLERDPDGDFPALIFNQAIADTVRAAKRLFVIAGEGWPGIDPTSDEPVEDEIDSARIREGI